MADETVVTGADTTQAVDTSITSDPVVIADPAAAEGQANAQTDPAKPAETPPAEVKYEFDEVPEGIQMKAEELEAFTALAKESNLSPENAKKFMAMAVQREQARMEQHQQVVKNWTDEVRADKELGGDKLAETLAVAKKAVALGPPELKEVLNQSGLSNHPAMVRWAFTIGKALSEDTTVKGEPVSAVTSTFYPNSKMNR